MAKQRNKIFCPKCGQAAGAGEIFCSNCGGKISQGENRQLSRPKSGGHKGRNNWLWITAVGIGAVFLISMVAVGVGSRSKGPQKITVAHNDSLIKDIVAEFDCTCGSCDKLLKNCDCPTALDEIKYIENAVAEGRYSRKEVIAKVAERYGGLLNKGDSKS